MKTEIIKLGKLEINLGELAGFLVEAKKKCYADGKADIIKDNSKIFTFQKGNFHYQDNYGGYHQFSGNQIVRWKNWSGQRIWQMNYIGGRSPKFKGIDELPIDEELTKQTYDFLKEALLQVTPAAPFRGRIDKEKTRLMASPAFGFYKDNKKNLVYTNEVSGGIKWFKGSELISTIKPNKGIYSLIFHGGIIIPK